MDPKQRTKLRKTIEQLLELSETSFQQPMVEKIGGPGWQAWLYRPTGVDSDVIHLELKIGAKYKEPLTA